MPLISNACMFNRIYILAAVNSTITYQKREVNDTVVTVTNQLVCSQASATAAVLTDLLTSTMCPGRTPGEEASTRHRADGRVASHLRRVCRSRPTRNAELDIKWSDGGVADLARLQ